MKERAREGYQVKRGVGGNGGPELRGGGEAMAGPRCSTDAPPPLPHFSAPPLPPTALLLQLLFFFHSCSAFLLFPVLSLPNLLTFGS